MKTVFTVLQIILSVTLVGLILIQNRGVGFGRVWGTGGSSFTRRGLEKVVFKLTFVILVFFILISILQFRI